MKNETNGKEIPKVLVTGANGLLGSHVVRQLLGEGYKVCAMIRKGSNLKALEGLDCDFFEGRVTEKNDVENAVRKCDFVVHTAARTTQSPSAPDVYLKVNVESTIHIVNASVKFGIKRLVYVSTANCFGNGTKTSPGNEQMPFLPWLKNSGYAYSKWLAQQFVLDEAKKNKLDVVVVNPTFMIGENDVRPSSGEIFGHVLKKRVVFYPPGGKNFVDATFAAKGVVGALEKGRTGECYLLTGENLSYLEFLKRWLPLPGNILCLCQFLPGF